MMARRITITTKKKVMSKVVEGIPAGLHWLTSEHQLDNHRREGKREEETKKGEGKNII